LLLLLRELRPTRLSLGDVISLIEYVMLIQM
jgi:hypothetical protein